MFMMKETLIAVSAGLMFGIGALPIAQAVTISIDDRTEIPTLDFGLGSGPNPVSENFTFSITGLPGTFTGVNVRFIIVDPGTTSVSDIFSLTVTPHAANNATDIAGGFQSDSVSEVPLTFVPNPSIDEIITETGNFQVVYSGSDLSGKNPDLVIQFASEVEPSVPEPGTLALLGVAFAGIGLARRRKLN